MIDPGRAFNSLQVTYFLLHIVITEGSFTVITIFPSEQTSQPPTRWVERLSPVFGDRENQTSMVLNLGRVKLMTLKFIVVTSYIGARIIRIVQGLVGLVSR